MINQKWLGAVIPLTMLLASCSDMPTGAAPSPSGLNSYLAPVGDVVVYGTGQAGDGGQIWAVNLTQGTAHEMWNVNDPNTGDVNSPNAVAFDAANGRMYFTVNSSTAAPFPFTPDTLYFFNVNPPYVAPVKAGVLTRTAYSGDFWNGSYYYVPNRTHDLMKVDLSAAGFKTGESAVCPAFRVGRPDANELFFGDIATRNGVVYGSVRVGLLGQGPAKFFRLTIAGCVYEEFDATNLLQLAWGGDGNLYGHDTSTGVFHVVNPNDGTLTAAPTYSPNIRLSDTAPAFFLAPAPSILIKKYTNGDDADTPTGPQIPVGGAVNWTYVVTNTGNVPLTNVTVTDDKGVAVTCPKTTLAVAEVMTCTGSGVAKAGQYANIGSVIGTSPPGVTPSTVTDTDPSHYFGVAQGINGCSPGYWKNHNFPAGYSKSATFASVFGNSVFGSQTLQQVLSAGGGGVTALGRQTVSALLNAAVYSDFGYTPANVIAMFNAVVPGTPAAQETLKDKFERLTDVNGRKCTNPTGK